MPEVDEPGVRGKVVRVSPEDLEVVGRFVLSPDQNYLVFSARPAKGNPGQPYHLYRINAAGGDAAVRLTSGGNESALSPSFSRDGKSIYFETAGTFWRMSSDGSGARTKIPGSGIGRDCCGQLSSADRLVFNSIETLGFTRNRPLFSSPSMRSLIWTIRPEGAELTQFREGLWPVWSHDGSKIAFTYEGDVWTMDQDGRNLTQITNTPKIFEGLCAFSPDDRSLAFASDETPSGEAGVNFNIWAVGTDGTGRSQLTQLRSWDGWPLWSESGVYFLSARGAGKMKAVRIWKLTQ